MHTLEKLSLNCGINPSKLDKPEIYTSFYPIDADKYIVIQTSGEIQSQNYSYYQDVVDFIQKELETSGYKIVQIGNANDQRISGCINLQGKTDIHQSCFILKNASLFIGNDSLSTYVCSSYGTPSITLYSIIQPEVTGPYWNNETQFTIMAPLSGKKPKYSTSDPEKTIDRIKPEQILEKIKLAISDVDLSKKTNINSIFFGKDYPRLAMELVPDTLIEIDKGQGIPLNIRFDYLKSKEISELSVNSALINILKRKCGIVTSKPFDFEKFNNDNIKQNISYLVINVEKKYLQDIDELISFTVSIKNIGINVQVALVEKNFSEEEINDLKLKFLNIQQINTLSETSWDECIDKKSSNKINDLTIFKSSRIIFSNGKNFLSKTAYIENKPSNSTEQKLSEIKNLKSLGKELECCYIYNL
jgi:hypothetical protein